MPSLIPGYRYDVFISYRQKDNRASSWVTQFVHNLRAELASTFKEDIHIYFDENSTDGIHDIHQVKRSVDDKLKCLVFIPLISQTYCDPKSFAWKHEFCAFNQASGLESIGRDIKLANGNFASRIVPIRIHDLDQEDLLLLETELGGPLRSIEFIYKQQGVNRPLDPDDDSADNLNRTRYRNQINKTANVVKEIINGLRNPNLSATPAIRRVVETTRKSIVVIPFANISNDPDQEYFSDGLTDEIITDLSQIRGLRVISRNSAMTFKGSGKRTTEIAAELGVEFAIEGAVRKAGTQVRITAQLVNASDESQMWTEKYEGDVADMFRIQERVSNSIVTSLKIRLTSEESGKLGVPSFKNQDAHELYQKGMYEFYFLTPDRLKRAVSFLEAALESEGKNALLLSKLSMAFTHLFNLADSKKEHEVFLRKARAYADDVQTLEGESARWHSLMGYILFFSGQVSTVLEHQRHAYEGNPLDTDTIAFLLLSCLYRGYPEEAQLRAAELVAIDPLHPWCDLLLGLNLYSAGKMDAALVHVRLAYKKHPHIPQMQLYIIYTEYAAGNKEEAMRLLGILLPDLEGNSFGIAAKLFKCAVEKVAPPADLLAGDAGDKLKMDVEFSWIIADFMALAGDTTSANLWLANAVDHGFINYPLLAIHDPYLRKLDEDDTFQNIILRVKREWESVKEVRK
jgi:TolB-like protein